MRRFAPAMIGAGLLLIGGGLLLLGSDPSTLGDVTAVEEALRPEPTAPIPTTHAPAPTPSTTTTSPPPNDQPSPTPDEKPITDPVELRIEALNITAPIGAYGVDDHGRMDIPDDVTEVGWYRFGPRPGEPGSAVLAAHVDLAGSGPGVFFELDTLEEGDRVSVVQADGRETVFRVVARHLYQKDELPLDVVFSRTGPPVLTLITCGGAFTPATSRYDSNVVVYAVPTTGADGPPLLP